DQEQGDDDRRPDEPELLADDRKDEVVPRVREVEPAGELALAQAAPEEPAEAECEEALDRVEARTERICPWVEEAPQPLGLVAAQTEDQDPEGAPGTQDAELPQPCAGQEEQPECRDADDDRRP